MAICGIAVNREGPRVDARAVEAMSSALSLKSSWLREHIFGSSFGVGATSFSATISSWESDEVAIVCDADIYNRAELCSQVKWELEDSNLARLLGQLYLCRGVEFLKDLRGLFSVAIWDRRRQNLLLAVDRFGVKPLCYYVDPENIIFASHPRGVFASGRAVKEIDAHAIVNYLTYSIVPAPLSAFKGMQKLPPASVLIWQEGHARVSRYWELDYNEDGKASERELALELLSRMQEAVLRTSQDVSASELGCFLSGGTDSSSVVGLATKARKFPVNTVSIGFAEERFDELAYVHIAAKEFGASHSDFRLSPEDAYQILPQIVSLYDEPFGNASVIPTYFCQAKAAEKGIRIMLAGDGGDELFGGNEHYRSDKIYQFYQTIPLPIRRGLIEPIASQISSSAPGLGKARRYVDSSNTPNPDRYFRWMPLQYFAPERILGPQMPFRNGHSDLLSIARDHYRSARASCELNRLLHLDVKMVLGDNDLPKVVRSSELAGIDVRFPYLDHPLAEFSGRIPARLKLKGLEKRYLFKRATRNLLPKAILQKKKHGFGLPIGLWLKDNPKFRQLAHDVLLDPRTYQRGYFRRDFVEFLFASMAQDQTPYYGDLLYSFLILELWHRKHVESDTVSASRPSAGSHQMRIASSLPRDEREVKPEQSSMGSLAP